MNAWQSMPNSSDGREFSVAASQVLEEARATIAREAAGVASLAEQVDASFIEAMRLLFTCEGKVFVTGAGTSGAVARRMAHLLSVCGTPSVFIQAADALHGTVGAVSQGDIVIAISRGGGSAEINELTRRAQDRGARVIALTAASGSELARLADVVALIESPEGVDPGEVIAMGSTLVVAAWGDAAALVLMRLRGYGWDAVLHSHPSGAVGQVRDAPRALAPLTAPWTESELA